MLIASPVDVMSSLEVLFNDVAWREPTRATALGVSLRLLFVHACVPPPVSAAAATSSIFGSANYATPIKARHCAGVISDSFSNDKAGSSLCKNSLLPTAFNVS